MSFSRWCENRKKNIHTGRNDTNTRLCAISLPAISSHTAKRGVYVCFVILPHTRFVGADCFECSILSSGVKFIIESVNEHVCECAYVVNAPIICFTWQCIFLFSTFKRCQSEWFRCFGTRAYLSTFSQSVSNNRLTTDLMHVIQYDKAVWFCSLFTCFFIISLTKFKRHIAQPSIFHMAKYIGKYVLTPADLILVIYVFTLFILARFIFAVMANLYRVHVNENWITNDNADESDNDDYDSFLVLSAVKLFIKWHSSQIRFYHSFDVKLIHSKCKSR